MVQKKRDSIKWVRDRAKAAYEKQPCCYICNATEPLDLHHYSSMTLMLEKWARQKSYKLNTDEDILQIRDEFIEAHRTEIYDEVVTLCKPHHQKLHQIYGAKPALATAKKQIAWVEKQKQKLNPTE